MGNTLQKLSRNPSKPNQVVRLQVKELEEDEPHQPFTCEICMERILLPNKKYKNQNRCVHPFCIDCITRYITIKLDHHNISNIRCPSPMCNQYIDPICCRNLVDEQLFVKWCDSLCESSIVGLAQCYCPNKDCSVLILDECRRGNVKKSKCPNCKELFCFKCKISWHVGLRCINNEQLEDENDVAFHVLARRRKWKRCPWCRHFVELIKGCKLITCRCGGNFCYKCGRRVYDWDCECTPWYKFW